jgi:hypothetical protein
MLGTNVFVFPDFGDAFLSSVKANALYAKQIASPVLVLTTEEEAWASNALSRLREQALTPGESVPEHIRRAEMYSEFILRAQPIVRPLVEAGILRAPDPSSVRAALARIKETALSLRPHSNADTVRTLEQFKAADPAFINLIRQARREMPPNFLDILPFFLVNEEYKPTLEDFLAGKCPIEEALLTVCLRGQEKELEDATIPLFGMMLALFAASFESSGIPIVWSQPVLRDGLWAVHRILSSSKCDPRGALKIDAEGILSTILVNTYLPAVHDLPIEEIMTFRTKYESELDGFRSAVSELAASIDVTQSVRDIERQARDTVRLKISPAVRDLRARIKIARLDALQKIGRSWQSLASLTFSSTIAVLAGAPLDISAFAGLVGTLGQALMEGGIERRKIVHSSQWAALIRFDELR